MISSSWGAPAAFTKGFNLQHVTDGLYGRHLHVYSWPGGELRQTLDLGDTGLLPLEASFSHNLELFLVSTSYIVFLLSYSANYTCLIELCPCLCL